MPPADAIAYLLDLPRYAGRADAAYKPGLERMEALMEAMHQPHEAFPSIHVAGTNGKGSTASMIAAIGTAAGLRTGLHTSPHMLHLTERLRIDGTPAPEEWLAEAVARFHPTFERIQPSFFEATVALSFLYFAEHAVDFAVIEVGLGGRLDATNILYSEVACITNIDLDHTHLLGDTLAAIAREKAGIIKPGVPVLTGADQPEALATIREIADDRSTPMHQLSQDVEVLHAEADLQGSTLDVRTPLRRYEDLRLGLPGTYQQTNALLALRAAELFGLLDDRADAAYRGLRAVRRLSGLRGRFEVLHPEPLIVADAAHNPRGLAAVLDAIHPALKVRGGTLYVAFGGVQDKDVAAMARLLVQVNATVFPLQFDSPRSMPAAEVRTVFEAQGASMAETCTVPDMPAHFRRIAAPGDVLLITGSHGVVIPLLEAENRAS